MMNVEIGVVAAVATAKALVAHAVILPGRTLAGILALVSQVVTTPILTSLRQGRSSLSAIPANINFTLIGGEAA